NEISCNNFDKVINALNYADLPLNYDIIKFVLNNSEYVNNYLENKDLTDRYDLNEINKFLNEEIFCPTRYPYGLIYLIQNNFLDLLDYYETKHKHNFAKISAYLGNLEA